MCRDYREDQIDFPVADIWRDHYFDQGLTPFHSPGYRACRDRLADRQDRIEESLKELGHTLQELLVLREETRRPAPKPYDPPKSLPARTTHTTIP